MTISRPGQAAALLKGCTLLSRMRYILGILDICGGSLKQIELQKYLFLYIQKVWSKAPPYQFIPYYYGCFSFQSDKDLEYLRAKELLSYPSSSPDASVSLAPALYGSSMIYPPRERDKMQLFFKRLPSLIPHYGDTESLISYVYNAYPEYTINTHRPDLLQKEAIILRQSYLQKRGSGRCFFTIGYEGKSIDEYLKQLIDNNVKVLCDVRKVSYSHKYGFSGALLNTFCRKLNIAYVHLPRLGIESEKRASLKTYADYLRLFDEYEKTTLLQNSDGIQQLIELENQYQRIAITCFEKDVNYCHRGRVAKAVSSITGENIIHL